MRRVSGHKSFTRVHSFETSEIMCLTFSDPLWRAPLFQVTDEVINRHGSGSNPDGDIKLFLEFKAGV